MVKNGSAKLSLDRVPALAAALECDLAMLLRMAFEQPAADTSSTAIEAIFGGIFNENETAIVNAIREASNHKDPSLSSKFLRGVRELFA